MEISDSLYEIYTDIWSYIPLFWDFDLGGSFSYGGSFLYWGEYGIYYGGYDGGYGWYGGSVLIMIESRYYWRTSGVYRSSISIHWSSAMGYPNQYTRYFRLSRISLWSKIFSISYSSSSSSKIESGYIDSHMGNNSGSLGMIVLRRYIWNIGRIL
jgi:hypothetical protein